MSPFEFELHAEAKRIANELMKANPDARHEIMERFCSYPSKKDDLEICPQCWVAEGKERVIRKASKEQPGMSCFACNRTFTPQQR